MSQPTTTEELRRKHKAYERLLHAAKAMIARLDDLSRRPNARIDTGLISDVEVSLKQAVKECEDEQ